MLPVIGANSGVSVLSVEAGRSILSPAALFKMKCSMVKKSNPALNRPGSFSKPFFQQEGLSRKRLADDSFRSDFSPFAITAPSSPPLSSSMPRSGSFGSFDVFGVERDYDPDYTADDVFHELAPAHSVHTQEFMSMGDLALQLPKSLYPASMSASSGMPLSRAVKAEHKEVMPMTKEEIQEATAMLRPALVKDDAATKLARLFVHCHANGESIDSLAVQIKVHCLQ